MDRDLLIRETAIRHCRLLSLRWGEAVPYEELARGFVLDDLTIKLVGPQGVFKPKELTDGALTLSSIMESRYEDEHVDGDAMLYDYAPPQREYENVGLKKLAALGRSVILLKQVKKKPRPEYMVFAPVALLGFDDVSRKVRLGLTASTVEAYEVPSPSPSVFSKRYGNTIAKARLHQAYFRRDTLAAYRHRCCVCELQERPLLEAAHIIPDRLPEGIATVKNGMSMCPTHHRAFDRGLLLVGDNYRVDVQRDRLNYADTEPTNVMLLSFDGKQIHLPKERELWPDPSFLRRRGEAA